MSKRSQRSQSKLFNGLHRKAGYPKLGGRKRVKKAMRGQLTHCNPSSVYTATIFEAARQKNLAILKERQANAQ